MEHEGSTEEVAGLLRAGLRELGLPEDRVGRLARLARLVARWAQRLNLTGHRGADAVVRRLILEALALGAALPESPPESLADLGSGAGFPGLPLAIQWPHLRLTSVESRERRYHFQRNVIRSLELPNVVALQGRAEHLAHEPHRIVVAQAMASPTRALAWMRPWVHPEGWIVLPQVADAPPIQPPLGIELVETRRYAVPLGGPLRALWIARITPRA